MISVRAVQRVRAFCFAAIAIAYYYAARIIAAHAAAGLASADWFDLTDRLIVLFLLLLGYGVMSFVFQRQKQPLLAMGFDRRPGWTREFGLGTALAWAAVLVSVLPVVLLGGLYVNIWTAPRQWYLLLLDAAVLLVWAGNEELVFRGYPFQRLLEACGPGVATLLIAIFATILQWGDPFAPRAGIYVAFLFNWLLCLAYLRTRALWLPIGLRFGWYAAMALLFGLPINGVSRYSPVVQSTARASEWLTGGDYGPETAGFTALVLIAAYYFLLRTTREYAHRYAVPEIVPAGIPVDIDAIARLQHQAGIGPVAAAAEASEPRLIQIGGIASSPALPSSIASAKTLPGDPSDDTHS